MEENHQAILTRLDELSDRIARLEAISSHLYIMSEYSVRIAVQADYVHHMPHEPGSAEAEKEDELLSSRVSRFSAAANKAADLLWGPEDEV